MVLQLRYIQLFSANISKSAPYAPWIISFSVPFGALMFLLKRRKIKKRESTEVCKTPDSASEITDESGS